MREVFKITCWSVLLCLVTTGLSLWGMWLDPWLGEMGTGEHPLIFLGVPLWACVIGLSGFGVHPVIAVVAGGLAQFFTCLLIVSFAKLFWTLLRTLFKVLGRFPKA